MHIGDKLNHILSNNVGSNIILNAMTHCKNTNYDTLFVLMFIMGDVDILQFVNKFPSLERLMRNVYDNHTKAQSKVFDRVDMNAVDFDSVWGALVNTAHAIVVHNGDDYELTPYTTRYKFTVIRGETKTYSVVNVIEGEEDVICDEYWQVLEYFINHVVKF